METSEDNFWTAVVRVLGLCFVAVLVSVSGCHIANVRALQSMVEHGAEPLAASCALSNGDGDTVSPVCILRVKP